MNLLLFFSVVTNILLFSDRPDNLVISENIAEKAVVPLKFTEQNHQFNASEATIILAAVACSFVVGVAIIAFATRFLIPKRREVSCQQA